MTKADLIDEVSRATGVTRKDSEAIIEAVLDSIVRSLRKGDGIEIRGFGSFRTRQRRARLGRNPRTGAEVAVPPRRTVRFKLSRKLLDVMNSPAGGQIPAPAPAPPDQPTP